MKTQRLTVEQARQKLNLLLQTVLRPHSAGLDKSTRKMLAKKVGISERHMRRITSGEGQYDESLAALLRELTGKTVTVEVTIIIEN